MNTAPSAPPAPLPSTEAEDDVNLPPLILDRADDGEGELPAEPPAGPESPELAAVREILMGGALKAVRRELHLTVRNLRGTIKRIQHEFEQKTDGYESEIAALRAQLEQQAQAQSGIAETVNARVEQ
ncbi:MAG: hypothetical protein AAGI15_11985, partial [Pseudomonadota bacterium]